MLGLWLAVSPWVAGYSHHEAATANAAFLGIALALGCYFEALLAAVSAEWLNVAAGVWLLMAPFVLGFASGVATINALAVGSAIALLAGSSLALDGDLGNWWHEHVSRR